MQAARSKRCQRRSVAGAPSRSVAAAARTPSGVSPLHAILSRYLFTQLYRGNIFDRFDGWMKRITYKKWCVQAAADQDYVQGNFYFKENASKTSARF